METFFLCYSSCDSTRHSQADISVCDNEGEDVLCLAEEKVLMQIVSCGVLEGYVASW